MTAIWGPPGWMTLHSVAHIYPIVPSPHEKELASQWLTLFGDTITCPNCQGHFKEMLAKYREMYPTFLDSRRSFVMFTYRAHNTVNRRLDKPVYLTSDECEDVYVRNIGPRSATEYRIGYINHIMRHWKSMHDVSGISAVRKVFELQKIEISYWSPRDSGNYERILGESVPPLPQNGGPVRERPIHFMRPANGVSFTGGRLRFLR